MKENLVNKFNRFIIGILILSIVSVSFFFKLDNYLIIIVSFLSFYDLYKSKVLNLIGILLLLILLILFVLFTKHISFFVITSLSLISIILFIYYHNYRRVFFSLSIIFFLLAFYNVSLIDRNIFYLLISVSFVNDTLAFLVGNIIKGPVIAPNISPNKTWSGTSFSFLLSYLILIYFGFNLFISIIIASLFFFGDLLFSFFKRKTSIKDFSSILISHGGILDRLDSMFLVFIFINFYLQFV